MTDFALPPRPIERVPSGVPGLDTVLRGGFLRGGLYVIAGDPGTGKTILVNQIGFHHVAAGGRVVYITLLAELHSRMLTHLQSLSFFDPTRIGDAMYYISGYEALQNDGLAGLLQVIQRAIRQHQASLVVLDGLATARALADSNIHFERFIQQVHAFVDLVGCTGLLVVARDGGTRHPEDIIVDGLLDLTDRSVGLRAARELEVRKFRGAGYLRGSHFFRITDDGIVVHPRTESLLATPQAVAASNRVRMGFDIPRLDEMLGGGLFSSSSTMILGPSGSGKTLLGMHFLAAGARKGEPGVHFGFHETPARLVDQVARIGLDVGDLVADGRIEIMWQSPLEEILDVLAERLLEAVRRRQARRLVIDGLNGFQAVAIYPERFSRFCTALMHELRRLDVTTLVVVESRGLEREELELPLSDVSAVVENIIFLRYQEQAFRRSRLLSILKLRESAYDPTHRAFTITAHGIAIATAAETVSANHDPQRAPTEAPTARQEGP